jgi:hypothetical protein
MKKVLLLLTVGYGSDVGCPEPLGDRSGDQCVGDDAGSHLVHVPARIIPITAIR